MKIRELLNVLLLNEKVKIVDSNSSLLWEGYCANIPLDYFMCEIEVICSFPSCICCYSYTVISLKDNMKKGGSQCMLNI